MNRYQHKRILACLKRVKRLTPEDKKFLNKIKDTPVVAWGKKDADWLDGGDCARLNSLASRIERLS